MKKLFALILALCLTVGLLPMAAMAEAPESVKVTFYVASNTRIYKTVADGDVAYVISEDKLITDWTDAEAPTDNFVKLEYTGGVLKVTFNNFDADMTDAGGYTCHGIEFPAGEYAIEVTLVGKNVLKHGKSASIKYNNDGGMTITGSGSLDMIMGASDNLGSASATLWTKGGDLVIKNTTINFDVWASPTAKHHAILAEKGNVTFENCKIVNNSACGGALVYTGLTGVKDVRFTLDPSTERFIKVKDCEITAKIKAALFESTNPAVISNSTVKITSSGTMFKPAPTLEGEYTAIAGLAKNAEKLDKLKEYNPKKLGSYTYFYMVPGKVDLLPTEEPTTEATEAPTTEAPTTEATEAPTTEATKPVTDDKNDATKPTTGDKNEATKPTTADKDDNKTDNKGEEKSGSPLKVILIILIALVVLGGGAVAVILILRNKNAELEEGEEEEEETEEAEEEEAEEAEEETEE